jgi:hypothetical protein
MASPELLDQIVNDFLPPGYKIQVKLLGGDLGGIDYDNNLIYLANPVSDERTLATFIHECAHFYLNHQLDDFRKAPPNLREFECEVWTLDKLIERGVYYEGAFQDAQALIRNRIVKDIREPRERKEWKGIYRPAYDFLTQEQKAEVQRHYSHIIEESMFKSNLSELNKWYQGKHTPQIVSMLTDVERRLAR